MCDLCPMMYPSSSIATTSVPSGFSISEVHIPPPAFLAHQVFDSMFHSVFITKNPPIAYTLIPLLMSSPHTAITFMNPTFQTHPWAKTMSTLFVSSILYYLYHHYAKSSCLHQSSIYTILSYATYAHVQTSSSHPTNPQIYLHTSSSSALKFVITQPIPHSAFTHPLIF